MTDNALPWLPVLNNIATPKIRSRDALESSVRSNQLQI